MWFTLNINRATHLNYSELVYGFLVLLYVFLLPCRVTPMAIGCQMAWLALERIDPVSVFSDLSDF